MDQLIVHQKRKVGSVWQWTELDLFSEDPFRWVTACSWKSTLMADDYVTIGFISREYVSFAVGDWCIINGRYYSVRSMADVTRKEEEQWEYSVVMYGVNYDLIKCIFRNCDMYGRSSTSYFDLTYTLEEFVKVIVYNMNRDAAAGSEEWEWGNDESFPFPTTDPLTISFQRTNCLTALQDICKQFDYEFRITQRWEDGVCIKTITVGQFSKTPQNATAYAYGMGEGLYQLKESKVDDSTIVTRLWVEGGQENVRSSYRDYAQFLQLPLRRWNRYQHDFDDGSSVYPHTDRIGITDDNKRYLEDADLIERYGVIEDSFQTDEIYPHFTGTIHSIGSSWSGGDGRLQFRANIGFDLNAKWAKQGTSGFQTDYAEWCYINGCYCNNLEDYERYCLLHGYTDDYHAYLDEHGYTEDDLSYSGWCELIMQGLIPSPASYTAFEQECGTALNTYNSIANSNGTKYLVDSSTCAKIAFITGKLAGQTFDVSAFTQKTVLGTTLRGRGSEPTSSNAPRSTSPSALSATRASNPSLPTISKRAICSSTTVCWASTAPSRKPPSARCWPTTTRSATKPCTTPTTGRRTAWRTLRPSPTPIRRMACTEARAIRQHRTTTTVSRLTTRRLAASASTLWLVRLPGPSARLHPPPPSVGVPTKP